MLDALSLDGVIPIALLVQRQQPVVTAFQCNQDGRRWALESSKRNPLYILEKYS